MANWNSNIDGVEHILHFGRSFDPQPDVAYHSLRYDFKPQSLNLKETSTVAVADNGSVTVKIPRIEGSGPTHSEYRGCKKKSLKECVLIIDHETGTFTLERLASNVTVKSIRSGGNSNNKSVSPTETTAKGVEVIKVEPPTQKSREMETKKRQMMNKSVPLSSTASSGAAINKSVPVLPSHPMKRSLSDASSSSSSSEGEGGSEDESSDSGDDSVNKPSPAVSAAPSYLPPAGINQLINEDLKLSESDSD